MCVYSFFNQISTFNRNEDVTKIQKKNTYFNILKTKIVLLSVSVLKFILFLIFYWYTHFIKVKILIKE